MNRDLTATNAAELLYLGLLIHWTRHLQVEEYRGYLKGEELTS
jgi:hypothetical protein